MSTETDSTTTLAAALDTLQSVIDVGPIPDGAAPTPCRAFDVDQLCEHILSTHAFLIEAAGGTAPTASGSFAEQHQAMASAAVSAWTSRGTHGTVDLGGNELPAGFGLSLHTLEAYVHGWDLAMALDRSFDPPPAATEAAWDAAHQILDGDGARGGPFGEPYGSAIEGVDSDDPVSLLIAFTGRDPRAPIAAPVAP